MLASPTIAMTGSGFCVKCSRILNVKWMPILAVCFMSVMIGAINMAVMQPRMFGMCHDLEIFNSVVNRVPIDMMHDFTRKQEPT